MHAPRKRLAEAVKAYGGPIKAAAALGCSRSYVDMLIGGKRERPGMEVARCIEALFGIRMQEWVPEPHVERVKRIA